VSWKDNFLTDHKALCILPKDIEFNDSKRFVLPSVTEILLREKEDTMQGFYSSSLWKSVVGDLPLGYKFHVLSNTKFNSADCYNYEEESVLRRKECRSRMLNEDPYFRKRVWDAIKSWYTNFFENNFNEAFLSSNGQHMSLPLSFVSLQAANNVAIRMARKRDHSLQAHALGDDAVLGVSNLKALDIYHKALSSIGAEINISKSIISKEGRFVFCEHTLDRNWPGRWCDLPRTRVITQPIEDTRGSRWTTFNEGISKWMLTSHRTALYRLKLAKFRPYLDIAIKYGYDPTLPVDFGGMELDYPNPNTKLYSKHVRGILDLSPKEMVKLDHKFQRAVRPHDKFSYSPFIVNRALAGAQFSFTEPGLKTHDAIKLAIDDFLPTFVYEYNYQKIHEVTDYSPKAVGYNFRRIMMSIPENDNTIDERNTRKIIAYARRSITVTSSYLNDLAMLRSSSL
jgi:hypothetical protein